MDTKELDRLERKRAYNREYRRKHPEKYKAYREKWIKAHPEEAKELNRKTVVKWQQRHRDEYNAYQKEWRAKKKTKLDKEKRS